MAATAKKKPKPKEPNVFLWTAVDKNGKKRKGEIQVDTLQQAKAELRKQGINPKSVKKKPKDLFGGGGKPIETQDIAIFARQLATMMSSGVPMVQAFELVGNGAEKPAMRKLIMGVKTDLESGTALADCLAKQPMYFDDLFCNLVRAGEAAGVLEDLLDKIATYKEKSEAIKKKIKKALSYPTSVLVVAVIVTVVIMLFVIPEFESLFAGFGADLPAFTQMVVNMSRWLQVNWWILLIAVVLFFVAVSQTLKRSRKARDLKDAAMLHVPVFGQIIEKAAVARFARTLSTMFAAGVPMVDALESVAGATGNIVYMNAVMDMREEVATGTSLTQAMKNADLFPPMVVQMLQIGEESGAIDGMLSKVADFYEDEVDNMVDSLSSLMEPMIMAILGVLVGGLVVAMYLPIFKMGAVVG